MRQRSINYFFGSLFSRQFVYAYGIAAGGTALFQQSLIWLGYFSGAPTRVESFPVFVELYIETLLPIWIGGVTNWNILMIITNVFLASLILLLWTARYSRTY
jgi:hypothetical protein